MKALLALEGLNELSSGHCPRNSKEHPRVEVGRKDAWESSQVDRVTAGCSRQKARRAAA